MARDQTSSGIVPRLMVIDSWPPMQRLLRIAAEAAGFADTTALVSAEAAREALAEASYDVVLIGSGVSPSDRAAVLAALGSPRQGRQATRVISIESGNTKLEDWVVALRGPIDIETLRQHLVEAREAMRAQARALEE